MLPWEKPSQVPAPFTAQTAAQTAAPFTAPAPPAAYPTQARPIIPDLSQVSPGYGSGKIQRGDYLLQCQEVRTRESKKPGRQGTVFYEIESVVLEAAEGSVNRPGEVVLHQVTLGRFGAEQALAGFVCAVWPTIQEHERTPAAVAATEPAQPAKGKRYRAKAVDRTSEAGMPYVLVTYRPE